MKSEQIREIADAILYEGYLLYPYRHSAIKNRQRWTFGVIYPRVYSEGQGINEPWQMRTECLVTGSAEAKLDITMRFLHLLKHTTEQAEASSGYQHNGARKIWEEGIAREIEAHDLSLHELTTQAQHITINFPAEQLVEMGTGDETATTIRMQRAITGTMIISAEQIGEELFKVGVLIENTGLINGDGGSEHDAGHKHVYQRDEVLLHSFVSTHTILQVQQGTFISLLEPPDELTAQAQACQNVYTWPVLIGQDGERDAMLSSPIILYDYPQIAPESIGTLFDGTEIDEILTLRIMTLTDAEKQEMRQADERVNALLERTEALTADDLMSLHGVIRNMHSIDEKEAKR